MEYWIIVDGKAQGPYGVADMVSRGVTPATLVWRQGMTEWVPASTVRELAEYFPADVREVADDASSLGFSTPPPSSPITSAQPPQCDAAPVQPNPTEGMPPMPATYLGWNIAATLLCCLPAGVIGVIFSVMTRDKYQRGDYEGAKQASSRAGVCLILSLVLGLIAGVLGAVLNLCATL